MAGVGSTSPSIILAEAERYVASQISFVSILMGAGGEGGGGSFKRALIEALLGAYLGSLPLPSLPPQSP